MASRPPSGGPYPPQVWQLGGAPSKSVDIPVTAVFLALFIGGAATHMTIFQRNKRRGHKFVLSLLLFGFCMARILTSVLRISSTALPRNLNLAIASSIFNAAGTLLLFIVNLLFAQRILRSLHPGFGWARPVSWAFKALYILIAATIIMVITVVVQSFFTLDPEIRSISRSIQLYGSTFFAVASFLPIPITLAALAAHHFRQPGKLGTPIEPLGAGPLRTKAALVLAASVLLCIGATYKCAVAWFDPVPRAQPMPDRFSKAAFYVMNFGVEVVVVYLYALGRVDRRFWVPNGASKRRTYVVVEEEKDEEKGNGEDSAAEQRDSVIMSRPGTARSEGSRTRDVDDVKAEWEV
ncbi:hypothetical protein H2199_008935 [Coniosporium tulheliwenetii]|uniref:Uncharacterized protein n=1 Tax=Coniosporium tulheliwenetii TaxID=3383036 RepID=A0ACC2YH49_9PEZI|nr:hypothetical protein H2199_008935 [Cladosporium sp. JES 115]